MSRNKKKKLKRKRNEETLEQNLHPDAKKNIMAIAGLTISVVLVLAGVGQAGPWGEKFYSFMNDLLGFGYYLIPAVILLFSAFPFTREKLNAVPLMGGLLFVISGLGFIDIVFPGSGGLTGNVIGTIKNPMGTPASVIITSAAFLISIIILINRPFKISFVGIKGLILKIFSRNKESVISDPLDSKQAIQTPLPAKEEEAKDEGGKEEKAEDVQVGDFSGIKGIFSKSGKKTFKNYIPPPLSLLSSVADKPTIGDLRANANIIKRTLESFGIMVEMGEINIGPTVTRYTLKPAEGIKISKITVLNQDLAMALASHPIRIEAPIPGKSLVGIEVPNKSAALVRLGTLINYPEFQKSGPLTFILGRNVSGEPVPADIDKMPHVLVAGSTGSGKSILIHSLIISLLYKNSPETLKLILIDPKRVELSVYNELPHLIAPVVTENKKAIGALQWLINEMDKRYQMLLEKGARDIKSYNQKVLPRLPYILVVIDELADLMSSHSREVEGAIIRLAQMSRATGIHLAVSTQRPSVEVITGLIKANITTRIALQVASQIDSRTILDTAGAEKLLGRGDLLFISSEFSKPKRIQGAYVTEEEVKKVAEFIVKNNQPTTESEDDFEEKDSLENGQLANIFEEAIKENGDGDELFEEAVRVVKEAKKASASFLQRRLKIGYARAARLLDIMEERGIVGPGEGAKPREIIE